jgi:pimeloyl-ACP methyl ester carboxylesterase
MARYAATSSITVDDVQLEVAWQGPARAPGTPGAVLVFLHEGLGSVALWRDVPAALAALTGRPAFVYSRQGYGASTPTAVPRPLTYMHDEAARLPRVLAAAGIADRDAVLVGHSDGASIAIIAAGSGAVAPRALVLIAPHVFVEDVSVRSIAAAAEGYRTGELRGRLARYHADVDGAFWGWNRAWLDPGFRAWNLEALLPAIAVPTLVVQGSADEYGTDAQVAAIARGLGGRCEVAMIANAGHTPQRDQPEAVYAAIVAFVQRVA